MPLPNSPEIKTGRWEPAARLISRLLGGGELGRYYEEYYQTIEDGLAEGDWTKVRAGLAEPEHDSGLDQNVAVEPARREPEKPGVEAEQLPAPERFVEREVLGQVAHPIEQVGADLRAMMPWIAANKIVDKAKN